MPGAALSLPPFSLNCYISFNILLVEQAFPVKLVEVIGCQEKQGCSATTKARAVLTLKSICGLNTKTSLCLRVICTQSRSHTTSQLLLLSLGQIFGTLLSFTFSEQHLQELLDPISNYRML